MAKLGKFLFILFIQLFVLKVVCPGLLPILHTDLKLLVLEESQENEESDNNLADIFLDDCLEQSHRIQLIPGFYPIIAKNIFSYYNDSLFIGFRNQSFKPPCAC